MSEIIKPDCTDCALKSKCFDVLELEELASVNGSKVEIHFKKKEIIAKQGAFASHIMYIKKGLVKLYLEGETGHHDVIVNFYPAGEVIGLASLFGKSTFDYSVAALEDATLCLIDINQVRQLVQKNGKFSARLIKRMNEGTLYAYHQLYDITNRQMNGRVAGALLHLAKNVFKSRKFNLSLTRKDLAEFTGMATMSVIRVLNDLKAEGIITDQNGVMEILNMDALEHLRHTG